MCTPALENIFPSFRITFQRQSNNYAHTYTGSTEVSKTLLLSHSVVMCFLQFLQLPQIISLNNIKKYFLLMETNCVFCQVRKKYLYII